MRMSTTKLIILRLYNVLLGRFALGDRVMRKALVLLLVKRRNPKQRYTASARCFDMRQLRVLPRET